MWVRGLILQGGRVVCCRCRGVAVAAPCAPVFFFLRLLSGVVPCVRGVSVLVGLAPQAGLLGGLIIDHFHCFTSLKLQGDR